MAGSKVIDRTTNGLNKLRKKIRELDGVEIAAGVPKNAKRHSSGINMLFLATIHEFGTATIPERSFIRSTLREKKAVYAELLKQAAGKVLGENRSPMRELRKVAEVVKQDMLNKIDAGVPPKLQDSTIIRKIRAGYDPPDLQLVATRQLRDAVHAWVRKERDE